MMESRKRPHVEDGGHSVVKKRALSSTTGSPVHANGVVDSPVEPQDEDELEHFRKGAIFRRMRHYSREHERSQRRITELEQRKTVCEADFAVIDACWTQLVDSIGLLVRREDLATADTAEDSVDLANHTTSKAPIELVESLRDRMRATQKLVATFVRLAGHTQPPSSNELLQKCQRAQTECTSLRSELKVTRSKLDYTEEQRFKCHNELIAAESRADRLHSRTIQAAEIRPHDKNNGLKDEEIEEEKPHELSPPAQTQAAMNGVHSPEQGIDGISKELLGSRDAKIMELERENAILRDSVNILRHEISQLPEETIANTPSYKVLLEHASKLENSIPGVKDELSRVREELLGFSSARSAWETSVIASASKEVEEVKSVLKKRDDENSRLRQQRDQQVAEINERKSKSNVKQAYADEYKTLAESRSERIAVLDSEVKRLRTRLAAVSGDEDLLSFLFNDEQNTMAYVKDLKTRLADSETRHSALNASLSRLREQAPDIATHIAAESEARHQLALAQQKLARYEHVFGPETSLSSELSELVKQLESKEEDLRVMRLRDSQREKAEAALYAELDKLSAAWEALDRQVKSKVFDLNAMEDRLTKHGLDKAKAENKFYSAMRDKEAIDTERKNAVRNLEKQNKVMENLGKAEKGLSAMVGSLEKEIVAAKKALMIFKTKSESLEMENTEWKVRAEGEKKRVADFRTQLLEQEKAIGEKNLEVYKLKEDVMKAKKEAEKAAARMKSLGSGSGSATEKEIELQNEVDKCMRLLKCSTCQNAMRSTVITKCMHSFCKSCVEARISHRQRKCPACNLAFAQSDVQTVFFQ